MVKEIALDLEEKNRLQAEAVVQLSALSAYRQLVTGMENNLNNRQAQLHLLQNRTRLLEAQLQAEKGRQPKKKTFLWTLRLLAATGVGFILGRF